MSMKSTGFVRKVDGLGRIVLPAEIREELGVWEKDGVEFFWYGGHLVLEKYEPAAGRSPRS